MPESNNTENQLDELNKRLGIIVALLMQVLPKESENAMTLVDKVALLDNLGVRPIEIAKLLGRTSTHINKELAGIRKKANVANKK